MSLMRRMAAFHSCWVRGGGGLDGNAKDTGPFLLEYPPNMVRMMMKRVQMGCSQGWEECMMRLILVGMSWDWEVTTKQFAWSSGFLNEASNPQVPHKGRKWTTIQEEVAFAHRDHSINVLS